MPKLWLAPKPEFAEKDKPSNYEEHDESDHSDNGGGSVTCPSQVPLDGLGNEGNQTNQKSGTYQQAKEIHWLVKDNK
jgi:hypothetical protein